MKSEMRDIIMYPPPTLLERAICDVFDNTVKYEIRKKNSFEHVQCSKKEMNIYIRVSFRMKSEMRDIPSSDAARTCASRRNDEIRFFFIRAR